MTPMAEEPPRKTTGERATLEGWAAVENEMLKHDEGTMKGHISDVDTLLVFAGLFSAVLTAFVVESYQQLQLDNSLGSMLTLRRISVQLESFTLSPGFINSSATAPPLPSLDFAADMPTRCINILWFISLIFSLAAALFGILVKQWIREYMQWHSALASPRDNVLVRQIRFENWNSWHIPATIATIPALLEMALVFFVAGIVILLWSLDPVVSAVITIVAAVFLAAASTFTIVPSVFQRCPYRSPTAWARAVAWDFFTVGIPNAIHRSQYRLGLKLKEASDHRCIRSFGRWLMKTSNYVTFRVGNWTALSNDWRARDLAGIWSSLAPGSSLKRGDATALLNELLSEQSCIQDPPQERDTIVSLEKHLGWVDVVDTARLPIHGALRAITELPPLVRALAWVSQASQDPHVQHSVLHCLDSLQSRFVLTRPLVKTSRGEMALTQEGVRSYSMWHLLVSFRQNEGLIPDSYDRVALKDVSAFRARNMKNHHTGNGGLHASYVLVHLPWLVARKNSSPATPMLIFLVALLFKGVIEDLRTTLHHQDSRRALRSARRAMELLSILHSFYELDRNDVFIRRAAECLVEILWATDGEKDVFESRFPGLRDAIWTVARYQLGADATRTQQCQFPQTTRPSLDSTMSEHSKLSLRSDWPLGDGVGWDVFNGLEQQTTPAQTEGSRKQHA